MDLRSGHAFWPIRDGLMRTYPALAHNERTDVAIVGAGITGALAAYELATAGADVVVVDRRDVASGSSAATTGLLQYATDTTLTELISHVGEPAGVRAYRLGLQAIDRIEALCDTLSASSGDDCGFTRRPSLYLASTAADVPTLRREYALRRDHGFDVDWLDRGAIEGRYGFSAPGAIYGRGDGEIDCYAFTHRLLAAAREKGARIYDRTNVEHLRHDRNGIALTVDGGHTIRARQLVCAAGYETSRYLRRKTGTLSSTWAFVSEPVDAFPMWQDRCLIWETARPYLYMRTTDDNRVLIGGEDEPFSTSHTSLTLLAKKTRRLLALARRKFPVLPLAVAYSWAGTFASTDDGLPFIGQVREHPDTWFALGYGGNGITFSMIAARLIRDAWLGQPNPDAGIFAFSRPTARGRPLLSRLLSRHAR
jgi:glycine/D-amino acid oxidase-like deaminating enzyme